MEYRRFGNKIIARMDKGEEILAKSLTGTINTMNGEFYTHIHMSAGNDKGEVFGGHLNKAVVSDTCEMVIDIIDGSVDRKYDEETGLNVFRF